MSSKESFAYISVEGAPGEAGLVPLLPITLEYGRQSVTFSGLLDTGASVDVLPYSFGQRLGCDWDSLTVPMRLTGNLANVEARALLVDAVVGSFSPVRLAFVWTRADNIPLILGQVNFFMEFDVCFFRSQRAFAVSPKS